MKTCDHLQTAQRVILDDDQAQAYLEAWTNDDGTALVTVRDCDPERDGDCSNPRVIFPGVSVLPEVITEGRSNHRHGRR